MAEELPADKPFVFTRHALNRLRRTALARAELERLARSSDLVEPSGNRMNCWSRWNDGWLRIVLVQEPDAIVVVTVIWPARRPRGVSP